MKGKATGLCVRWKEDGPLQAFSGALEHLPVADGSLHTLHSCAPRPCALPAGSPGTCVTSWALGFGSEHSEPERLIRRV